MEKKYKKPVGLDYVPINQQERNPITELIKEVKKKNGKSKLREMSDK